VALGFEKLAERDGGGRGAQVGRKSVNLRNDLAFVRAAKASGNGNALAMIFIVNNGRALVEVIPGWGQSPSTPGPPNGFLAKLIVFANPGLER